MMLTASVANLVPACLGTDPDVMDDLQILIA
jgi:hypothetical protein